MDNSVRQYLKSLGVSENGIEFLEKQYVQPTRDSIDRKISGLRERGFSNPVKMIKILPSILGLLFDNIDRKIKDSKDARKPIKIKQIKPSK